MELRQLQYFCTAAKYEHISKAADELLISQPALTRTIKQLEEELNISLFESKGRGIRLTPLGMYFYHVVSRLLDDLNSSVRQLQSQSALFGNGIMLTNEIPELYPYMLRAFLSEYPGIPVSENNHTSNAIEGAERMQTGFILSYQPLTLQGFHSESVLKDSYCLLVAPNHRFAALTEIDLTAVKAEPHIAYSPLPLPTSFEHALPHPNYLISDLHSLICLVAKNYGVAIIPRLFWALVQPELQSLLGAAATPKLLTLKELPERLHVYLTAPNRSDLSDYEDTFLSFCREYFHALPEILYQVGASHSYI